MKKHARKRQATRPIPKKVSRQNKFKRVSKKSNRNRVSKSKSVSKSKKAFRNLNTQRKVSKTFGKNARGKNKRKGLTYSEGTGQSKDQFTLWFPKSMPEKDKLAAFGNWDASPIQKYIVKARRWKIPIEQPQSLWVKLIKRKPRDTEYYYSSQLTPADYVITQSSAHEFAYRFLETYYKDHIGHIKEKIASEPVSKFKDSSPDDYEGKPMKVVGIIFHFLYY